MAALQAQKAVALKVVKENLPNRQIYEQYTWSSFYVEVALAEIPGQWLMAGSLVRVWKESRVWTEEQTSSELEV